jgi:hypothetical protein
MHTLDGVLAVTVIQEGLLRPTMAVPPEFEERLRQLQQQPAPEGR